MNDRAKYKGRMAIYAMAGVDPAGTGLLYV